MFRQADEARGVWGRAARSVAALVLAAGIAGSATAQSYRTISVDDDDKKVLVKMEDGEIVFLKVNGKEVDPDSIVYADGGIWAMSGDSKVDLAEVLRDLPEPPAPPVAIAEFKPRPIIGVNVGDPSRALRLQLGLKDGDGIVITGVQEGMAADKAGLTEGDIIVGIEGKRGLGLDELRATFDERGVGGTVELQVIRQGKVRDFDVTLEASSSVAPPSRPRFPALIRDGQGAEQRAELLQRRAIEFMQDDEQRRAFVLRNREAEEAMRGLERLRVLDAERNAWVTPELREGQGELRFFTLPDADELKEGYEEALLELEIRLEEQSDEIEFVVEELEERLAEALEEAESQLEDGAEAFEDKFSWTEDRFFDTDERFEEITDEVEARFEEIEERWDEIAQRFDEIEERFDEQEFMMTRSLQAIERQMDRIAERLERE